MFWTVVILIAGLAMVVLGSDWLVDGASDVARRSGLSEFVIGMTIVGIGTSTPEMVVSFLSSFHGQADMSAGNIIGSNIFNTFFILGITALILPMKITEHNIKRDIPINIAAALLLLLLAMDFTLFKTGDIDCITRVDGAVMLACFAAYMFFSFKEGKVQETPVPPAPGTKPRAPRLYKSILMIAGGLAGLIYGGNLFVGSATDIARNLGWSDKFIAVTILAVGTSLPELATCIVAAVKGKGQLALGNIIGSNISNILLILGGAALIHPLTLTNINAVDVFTLLLSAIFLFVSYFTFVKKKIDRVEGVCLLFMEACYMFITIKSL